MKTMISILLGFLILGCQKDKDVTKMIEEEKKNQLTNSGNSPVPAQKSRNIKIYQNGEILAEITTGESSSIKMKNLSLSSKRKDDKKKYYSVDGKLVFEIKYKEGSFKLRDPSGKLLRKVKIKEEKFKISDNEENLNPFELKQKEDRIKIVLNEKEIDKIQKDPSTNYFVSKENSGDYSVEMDSLHPGAGVIFLPTIPVIEKIILTAEIAGF
ncbi:MAG: hypothetical protein H7A24_01550 [Leptospiraceae bacterium]|nr:hypothetical protein [Leptospiraceae bacterium]MCP5510539.1 hypothetical protein [Leptospiraceae bacterium]